LTLQDKGQPTVIPRGLLAGAYRALAALVLVVAGCVRQYLERIEAFDQDGPRLNSMIFVNGDAITVAKALDEERRRRGARGALHGIPVILKDNYDTVDMPTTGGSIALAEYYPPDDGYQVRKLRDAGAVIVGKSNLHELARGITTISSLGGQTLNPYDPARNPGGSSGGTGAAIAANFAAVGMGSDTCGSIRIPSANNNLFGLRVTQGLSSRDGIIPLSHTQDVGGPLARTMIDLAIVLDATVGPDPADPQTVVAGGKVPKSFAALEGSASLEGLRMGLLKSRLSDAAPYGEMTDVVMRAVEKLKAHGAVAVEVDIDGLDELFRNSGVIGFEFNDDFRKYLGESGAPISSVQDILDQGQFHVALEERFLNPYREGEDPADLPERLKGREALALAIDTVMSDANVDVLVYPTLRVKPKRVEEGQFGSVCQLAAQSGYPALSMPAGFTDDGVPVGIELLAKPFEDEKLIAIGFGYERIATPRLSPARTPSLINGALTHKLEFDSPGVNGRVQLNVPTQTLEYRLSLKGTRANDIRSSRIHRGGPGESGPVIGWLDTSGKGRWTVPNEYLRYLMSGELHLQIATHERPAEATRAQIVRH
jgi:Asp-tRNA(Asn)/Glu-tRNA(Gln) amidotransferase A subunit family amidase